MGMFSVRKPRGFHHTYIYYDERKERLQKIEDRAKRELGMLPPEPYSPDHFKGEFVKSTTHLKRRKESGRSPASPLVLLALIAVLLWVWYAIVNGII